MTLLANSKPDGYTICVVPTDSLVITPLIQKVPFKPLKSFTPILGISATVHAALIVQSNAPWKTLRELIDYARKNPGKIKYSTSGVGTGMHAAMELIANKENIKWVHVPYKGNTAAITALLGGHVDVCSAGVGFAPFIAENKVRALVSYWKDRAPQFPNVPTMRELGYDFIKETVHSIFGPADMPAAIVSKLEMAFTKGTEPPEFKALLEKLDCTMAYYPSKEFKPYLEDLWVRSVRTFKEAGIIKEPLTQPY
jgi:tripartite-type tricarboxylate transporter receptor subunit TctC